MKSKLIPLLCLFASLSAYCAPNLAETEKSFRKTLADLVHADTTSPPGNESRAVEIYAKRLKDAGIPYEITEFAPGRQNIVARLKGNGSKKPLLLLAHMDVVGVKDQKWSTPPHEVTEKDGFLYGRGVLDDLGPGVTHLETFLALKKEGVKLDRDVILAMTGDEESGGAGIQYLLAKHPEMVDAEIALNEGGYPALGSDSKVQFYAVQVAEKIYQDFVLIAKGPTGHSSIPRKGNSIYKLARALEKLDQRMIDYRLIPATRAFFGGRAKLEKGATAKAMLAVAQSKGALPAGALKVLLENPYYASLLSTSCVPTMLSGGTRVNALPPEARVNINCRILPDETVDQVKQRLAQVIGDSEVEIQLDGEFGASSPSPVEGEVTAALRDVVSQMWPGAPVIPYMQTGATDSRYLRLKGIRAYGVMGLAIAEPDVMRAHGIDERIPVASIQPAIEFTYNLVKKLAAQN